MSSYTLKEIAAWQFADNTKVTLPTIQRGFVWKPHQIEIYGIPSCGATQSVPSCFLSKRTVLYDLMDGQQRYGHIFRML